MKLAATLAAVFTAAVLSVGASGDPLPATPHIAVTHARPVAGHSFVGVTITPNTTTIESVSCPATIGHKTLQGHRQRYYDGDFGLIAITCSWHVPASARGRLAAVVTVDATPLDVSSPNLSWRIKR